MGLDGPDNPHRSFAGAGTVNGGLVSFRALIVVPGVRTYQLQQLRVVRIWDTLSGRFTSLSFACENGVPPTLTCYPKKRLPPSRLAQVAESHKSRSTALWRASPVLVESDCRRLLRF